jgi:hypothetical protein
MKRHWELLNNFTEIFIGFSKTSIGQITGYDTHFCVRMELFDAGNTCFKAFAGIETVKFSTAGH